jgi:hypothetical protein
VVRLADAAAVRDQRRRVVLAERLAEAEVLGEAVAMGSLELVSNVFPAVLEALEAVIKPPEVIETADGVPSGVAGEAGVVGSADDGLLERLIRADPERARRVLDTLTDTTGPR